MKLLLLLLIQAITLPYYICIQSEKNFRDIVGINHFEVDDFRTNAQQETQLPVRRTLATKQQIQKRMYRKIIVLYNPFPKLLSRDALEQASLKKNQIKETLRSCAEIKDSEINACAKATNIPSAYLYSSKQSALTLTPNSYYDGATMNVFKHCQKMIVFSLANKSLKQKYRKLASSNNKTVMPVVRQRALENFQGDVIYFKKSVDIPKYQKLLETSPSVMKQELDESFKSPRTMPNQEILLPSHDAYKFEPNQKYPPGNRYFNKQWYLFKIAEYRKGAIDFVRAWRVFNWNFDTKFPQMTVAVLSSGVNYDHHDLKNNRLYVSKKCPPHKSGEKVNDCKGWNFVNDNSNVTDYSGEGTALTTIIAAHPWDMYSYMMPMCPQCKVFPMKVVDNEGFTSISTMLKALDFVLELKPGVVLIPQTFPYSEALHEAINKITNANILVVAATGDNGFDFSTDQQLYPACTQNDYVISVTATDKDGKPMNSANRKGDCETFSAPGEYIFAGSIPMGLVLPPTPENGGGVVTTTTTKPPNNQSTTTKPPNNQSTSTTLPNTQSTTESIPDDEDDDDEESTEGGIEMDGDDIEFLRYSRQRSKRSSYYTDFDPNAKQIANKKNHRSLSNTDVAPADAQSYALHRGTPFAAAIVAGAIAHMMIVHRFDTLPKGKQNQLVKSFRKEFNVYKGLFYLNEQLCTKKGYVMTSNRNCILYQICNFQDEHPVCEPSRAWCKQLEENYECVCNPTSPATLSIYTALYPVCYFNWKGQPYASEGDDVGYCGDVKCYAFNLWPISPAYYFLTI